MKYSLPNLLHLILQSKEVFLAYYSDSNIDKVCQNYNFCQFKSEISIVEGFLTSQIPLQVVFAHFKE